MELGGVRAQTSSQAWPLFHSEINPAASLPAGALLGAAWPAPGAQLPGLSEGVSLTHHPWVPSSRLAGPATGHWSPRRVWARGVGAEPAVA